MLKYTDKQQLHTVLCDSTHSTIHRGTFGTSWKFETVQLATKQEYVLCTLGIDPEVDQISQMSRSNSRSWVSCEHRLESTAKNSKSSQPIKCDSLDFS